MIKRILFLTLLVLCIVNVSFAETQHFPLDEMYRIKNDYSVTQFNGMTVNGLTVQEANEKAQRLAHEEAVRYLGSQEALRSHFNAIAKMQKVRELSQKHERLSNITARNSFRSHKTPFDFVEVMGDYMHWLPGINSEETCEHKSYAELKEHAEVYTALLLLRVAVLNSQEQMKQYEKTKSAVREIFSKQYDGALSPFYEAKKKELQEKADNLNRNMKDYNCRAVLDVKDNEARYLPVIGGFFPRAKTTYCKSRKKCKFFISEAGGILKMECECGHAISEHQYKLKKE